jgi:hypothetical protein
LRDKQQAPMEQAGEGDTGRLSFVLEAGFDTRGELVPVHFVHFQIEFRLVDHRGEHGTI